jgi:hypothetical protein
MDEYFPHFIRQWLGGQRSANNEYIDQTTKQAAGICGSSQATSDAAKATEPVNRKERARYNAAVKPLEENALQDWAEKNGLWISEKFFLKQYASRYIGAGAE